MDDTFYFIKVAILIFKIWKFFYTYIYIFYMYNYSWVYYIENPFGIIFIERDVLSFSLVDGPISTTNQYPPNVQTDQTAFCICEWGRLKLKEGAKFLNW